VDNVKLVADGLIQDKGPVLWIAKRKHDGMTVPDGFAQPKNEESRGIRFDIGYSKIAGGNHNSPDRLLLSGIRILDQNGPPERKRLLSLPVDQLHNASGKQHRGQQSAPSFDFVSASHASIAIIYMMTPWHPSFLPGMLRGHSSCILRGGAVNIEFIALYFVGRWHQSYSIIFQSAMIVINVPHD
jgi:hypothetical protein